MSKKKFEIGDKVSVINDTITGVIIDLRKNLIVIQSEDGFNYNCDVIDLIHQGNLDDLLNHENHDEFLKENFSSKKKEPTVSGGLFGLENRWV